MSSACNNPDKSAEPTANSNKTHAEIATAPDTEAAVFPPPVPTNLFNKVWTGDLDGMEERRVIRVLTVYGLGRYYLDEASEEGMVFESMRKFEDYLNKQLGRNHLRVHVVIIPVARNQLIPALQKGLGDMAIAELSITPEREQLIDFSMPVSKSVSEILITGSSAPVITRIEDLAGKTIALRLSSSYRESVERLNQRLVAQGLAAIRIEAVSELLEDEDLVEMVNGGLLPWAIVDNSRIQQWQSLFEHIEVRENIVFSEGNYHAWAMRKNSPQLMEMVNAFVNKHREGTLFGNVMVNRYIRDFDWQTHAMSNEENIRFNQLRNHFQTYGESYGIDYLLAAAQGYQESRLDQSKRSHRGAIGIMQLLPSTAADPNVGIPDISQSKDNIHAGIKYLSFLRDRYFSADDIEPLDQALLALAAYNMGPARVRTLREHATKKGYDPNRWFDNVEIIAAHEVGREPVQYVANIFKYYQSYRLSRRHEIQHQKAREAAGIISPASF
ncbi:MAG: transglycosylase SLT domain-containing protein [Parahaliea sp.]